MHIKAMLKQIQRPSLDLKSHNRKAKTKIRMEEKAQKSLPAGTICGA